MAADPPDARPRVVIFRLQLFKPSETFVAGQAQTLERFRPIYVGWRRHGAAPAGAVVVSPPSRWAALKLCVAGDPVEVRKAARGAPIALVHAHFGVDGVFARGLARRLGVPLIVTLHGFDVSRRRRAMLASLRPAWIAYGVGWPALARSAARFIAVSPSVYRRALGRGVDPRRLERIETGVDVAALQPGGPGETSLIVHVGRLVEKKGSLVLLRAFVQLAAERPDARLVVIGEGPLRGRLEAEIAQTGLQARMTLTGALPHDATLDWLSRAAVVAIPSVQAADGDAEGLPTVLVEAAALARPIVASAIDAIAEALPPEAVRLCPPGDAAALARAMMALLADRRTAAALGTRARQHVEAHYDLRRQTRIVEDLYDSLTRPDVAAEP